MIADGIAPYGRWESALTAAMIAASDTRLRNLQVTPNAILWLEIRPAERGRGVIVRWTPEAGVHDVTPPAANVGTRVHEYGGGEYRCADQTIVYSEKSDGSVWLIAGDEPARQIVAVADCRYADFELDLARRCVYAVCEDHRGRSPVDPLNRLVALELDPTDSRANVGRPIFTAADFVAAPKLSPDGTQVAWLAWDHPNMPWDHTRLLVAACDALDRPRIIAGETEREAIEQLAWSPAGELVFTSDRSGWANVYAWQPDGEIRALAPARRDFSRPAWQFGMTAIAPLADGRVVAAYAESGMRLAAMLAAGEVHELNIGQVQDVPLPFGAGLAFIAEPPDAPAAVERGAGLDASERTTLRAAAPALLDPADVSVGRPMTFAVGAGEVTHAFFFPPVNRRARAPQDTRPPLIVTSHGGPTSMRTNALNLAIQFWTNRGFAVADVNYRGSTGFGVAYRDRLRGQWGVTDVEDCIAVAQGLIAAGAVDPDRIAIRGGSSSGFTTLAALAASRVFRAGASYYPVTDLTVFTGETHKFESRYVDGLIGPPEAIELYRARSPVANAAAIVAPVAIFQGLDDKVVPPNQSERMVAALRANGTSVEYHAYAGEGHGFLKAETLEASLAAELAFYQRALDLR